MKSVIRNTTRMLSWDILDEGEQKDKLIRNFKKRNISRIMRTTYNIFLSFNRYLFLSFFHEPLKAILNFSINFMCFNGIGYFLARRVSLFYINAFLLEFFMLINCENKQFKKRFATSWHLLKNKDIFDLSFQIKMSLI